MKIFVNSQLISRIDTAKRFIKIKIYLYSNKYFFYIKLFLFIHINNDIKRLL